MKLDIRRVVRGLYIIGLALAMPVGQAVADSAGYGKHSKHEALFSTAEYTEHITYLASDELEGRGTGQPGIDRAAEYIAAEFKKLGLKGAGDDGTYFQNFTLQLKNEIAPGTRLAIGKNDRNTRRRANVNEDYVPFPFSGRGSFEGPVVFAGYGIIDDETGYNDYAGIDVADKVVMIFRRTPKFKDVGMQNGAFQEKAKRANARDAAALLIVNPTDDAEGDRLYKFEVSGRTPPGFGIPMLHISRKLANSMLKSAGLPDIGALQDEIEKKKGPCSRALKGVTVRGNVELRRVDSPVRNIAAMVEGTGPNKDEIIIVGGHYDHLGIRNKGMPEFNPKKDISNGADDNASGTTAVMMLAKAFSQGPKPNRSIVFMLYTGEELGLLGSSHFANDPTFDLTKAVAMLNLDMVGRLNKNKLEVGGMKTGVGFEKMVRRLAEPYGFNIRDGGGGRGPSDHTSFYDKNIPVLFFFTGLHRQYHEPEDDTPLVNIEGAVKVARLVADCIDEIDEIPERVVFAKDTSRATLYDQRRDRDEEPKPAGEQIARGPGGPGGVSPSMDAGQGRGSSRTERPAAGAQRRAEPPDDEDEDDPPARAPLAGPDRVRLGITPDPEIEDGVGVAQVTPDSPAAKAGIKPEDVIVKIGDQKIGDVQDLMAALGKFKPGDKTKVTVERGDKPVTLDVTFPGAPAGRTADAPARPSQPERPRRPDPEARETPRPSPGKDRVRLGIEVDEEVEDGVGVAEVTQDSAAAKAKMKAGDVIVKIGSAKIEAVEDVVDALAKFKPGDKTKVVVKRDGKEVTLDVTFAAAPAPEGRFTRPRDEDEAPGMRERPGRPQPPDREAPPPGAPGRVRLGVMLDPEEEDGAGIVEVSEDTPAARAKIREGDVITKFGSTAIEGAEDLIEAVGKCKPGDKVKVSLKRDGKEMTVDVSFGEAPRADARPERPRPDRPTPGPGGGSRAIREENERALHLAIEAAHANLKFIDADEPTFYFWKNQKEATVYVLVGDVRSDPKGKKVESRDALMRELEAFLDDAKGVATWRTNVTTRRAGKESNGQIVLTITLGEGGDSGDRRRVRPMEDDDHEEGETSKTDLSRAVDLHGTAETKRATPSVRLGIMPSYGEPEGEGYEISGVVEGGPAAKAGMKDHDRILKIGKKEVKDIYSYMDALLPYKAGQTVEVVVLRDGKQVTLKIKAEGPKLPD